MLSGTFLTGLKYAIVKPLLKKGDKENVAKYTLIFSLTSFSKVLEKIIYDRLLKHIETNNIFAVEQFGFSTSSSTEKASYKPTDDILNALSNRMKVGGIFFFFYKAFDCVNPCLLLTKSEFYGITGITRTIIKTYLQGRYQKVVLNNYSSSSCSKWDEITHGVPQGSIIGPILFLLYIIDLLQITNEYSKIVLFADDTSIFIKTIILQIKEKVIIKPFRT
jgi:hypothetical protein